MELKGTKRIEIVGVNDKRQITALFCGLLASLIISRTITL